MVVEPWALVDVFPDAPESVDLPADEARHLTAVLRLAPGDAVVVADGRGRTAQGTLRAAGKSRMAVDLGPVTRHPAEPPGVTLALGVLHGKAQELVVRQAVEVGVRRFVPVVAERSQLGADAVRGRLDRWRRIARQAIKQCHRPWVPEIAEPTELEDVLAADRGVLADPSGAPVESLRIEAPVTLLVGPEGGLTEGEIGQATEAGWRVLRLGDYTLRAETAAVAGAALVAQHCRR